MIAFNVRNLLLCGFAASGLVSTVQVAGRTLDHQRHPAAAPLHSLSRQFIPLQKLFANVPRAGYYTDKNLDNLVNIAQFEQAQYILAPTVLELNNTALPLIIFDCTTPAAALAKIRDLGLTPVSASSTGLVLAVNPPANQPAAKP